MIEYLSTREVAEYLSIPITTIYQWRYRGTGPRAAKVGRHLRWRREDVDRWFEDQAKSTTR